MYNDKETVSRILSGNLHAFKLLVTHHEHMVNGMVRRLVQDREDVSDVSQEVFIKVYQHLRHFKFQSSLRTWIGRIAYTTAVNHLKKNASRKQVQNSDYTLDQHEEDETSRKSTAAFLQAEIRKLPEQYRLVLTLYHLNEFSYEEIGQITGMPEGTVKNYLFRARKLLKERLEKYNHLL